MRTSVESPSGARGLRGCRATIAVLAAVAMAAVLPFLAGCRVTVVTPAPVVNPFVGTWSAEIPGQRITYRFGKDDRYERESTTSSISVSISGTYAYDSRTRILSLTPALATIAPERFSYEFTKSDELVLTTYPRGSVNVTLTFRRDR